MNGRELEEMGSETAERAARREGARSGVAARGMEGDGRCGASAEGVAESGDGAEGVGVEFGGMSGVWRTSEDSGIWDGEARGMGRVCEEFAVCKECSVSFGGMECDGVCGRVEPDEQWDNIVSSEVQDEV